MDKKKYYFIFSIIIVTIFAVVLFVSNLYIHPEEQDHNLELEGIINHVVDGDTLDINDIRVRLALVDTPERGQDGYNEAKDFVKNLCLNKKGELDIDDGQRRGDRYGREIGVVYCDGININQELVENNLAKIYIRYCDVSEFAKEQWAINDCT